MDSPKCNNATMDWHMRMPTDLPPVDLKVQMLSQLCKEEGATLEQTLII